MNKKHTDEIKQQVVRAYETKPGLTLDDLAERYDVSRSSIKRWVKDSKVKTRLERLTASMLLAQEIAEVRPNIRVAELSELVGVKYITVYKWMQRGVISLDIQCEICGESTTTRYCRECASKGWDALYRTYNLTIEQLRALPETCEICGAVDKLRVDHDHETGKYRGVLCHSCNVSLGLLKEDITSLKQMIKYIKKHK